MSLLSYQLLRKNVEHRLGITISSARECVALSQALLDVVQAKVSITTIKRFWGLVSSDVKPSKFTLNALSRYVGYVDFPDFEQGIRADDTSDSSSTWENYRSIAREISEFSLNCLKSRMGMQRYSSTLRRDFTKNFFDSFRSSGKVATAMVAPSGWGKSVNVAHIVDEYFIAGGSQCYGDLLFYFDMKAIVGFSRYTQLLEELFISMLGGSGNYDFKSLFLRHPNWRKGDVYIVIDSVSTEEQLSKIIALVNNYSMEGWLHIIFTCRPTLWILGSKSIPLESQHQFHNLDCSANETTYCNVPTMSIGERLLMLFHSNTMNVYSFRLLCRNEVNTLLSIPSHMSILQDQTMRGNFSVLDLLWAVFKTKVAERSSRLRLSGFLSNMLEATNYGRIRNVRVDSKLFMALQSYSDVFEIFSALGVIKIKFFDDAHMDAGVMLTFNDGHFFEFILFSYWLSNNGYIVDMALMESISAFYNDDEHLKLKVLKWIFRYAFREGVVDCVSGAFDFAERAFSDTRYVFEFRNLVCSLYASHPGIRHLMMRSDAELIYYLCNYSDVDHLDSSLRHVIEMILERQSCRDYHLRAYMVYIYSYFIDYDKAGCERVYARLSEFLKPHKEHSTLDYLVEFAAQMMMEAIETNSVSVEVLQYVEEYLYKSFADANLYDEQLLSVGFIMIDVLVLTRNYAVCKKLTDIILRKCDGVVSGYVYNIAIMMNISSLLHAGRLREACDAAMMIDMEKWFRLLPDSHFYFFSMRLGNLLYLLLKAGYNLPDGIPLKVVESMRASMRYHFRHTRIQERFPGD